MTNREFIIGLVAPIGSKNEKFFKELSKQFKDYDYAVHRIKITDLLCKIYKIDKLFTKTQNLKIFTLMELCTELRKRNGKGYLIQLVIDEIKKIREKNITKRNVYFIDQLKNSGECDFLNAVYGENYIQVSCYSNMKEREMVLKKRPFLYNLLKKSDSTNLQKIANKLDEILSNNFSKDQFIKSYNDLIQNEEQVSDRLIEKDSLETLNEQSNKDYGQQLAKIFSKSHYYIALENGTKSSLPLKIQTKKLIELLFGDHNQYPTQDEVGMEIAYSMSKRSNFPGDRHVGACIISEFGEIISAASIRAPSPNSNTTKNEEDLIKTGYKKAKQNITKLTDALQTEINKCGENKLRLQEASNYLRDSIEFHPCTHAEISSINDAAKLGISVRNTTLYTTTFPCHICAKDIITAGISKVMFIEPYPKSKNKDLYSEIINLDNVDSKNFKDKTPFLTFYGVGPRRYHYFYSLKNRNDKKVNYKENNKICIPPLLEFRVLECYLKIEELAISTLHSNVFRPFLTSCNKT